MRKLVATSVLLASLAGLAGCVTVNGEKTEDKASPSASANAPSADPAPTDVATRLPDNSNPNDGLLYAYDPCALIPSSDVRRITGDQSIIGPTQPEADRHGYKRCNYSEKNRIGLPSFYVATSYATTQDEFLKIPKAFAKPNVGGYYTDKLDLSKSQLNGKVDFAYMVYVDPAKSKLEGPKTRPHHTSRIVVLKGRQVIVIHWRGPDKNTHTLEMLALSAIRHVEQVQNDTPYYPGK